MTKAELRRLKYHAIMNAYHNAELAQRAREWSEKRIEYELGVKLPKTIPKLRKDVTKETKRRYEAERKKFEIIRDSLIRSNVDVKEAIEIAIKNKKQPYKYIDYVIENYQYKYNPIKIVDDVDYIKNPLDDYMNLTKAERIFTWADWAKKNNDYPEEIEALAEKINLEKKLDKDHSLGWAVVYQAFINDQDIDKIIDDFEVDKFLPQEYVSNVRLRN